jgi:glycosyltransferase involved in cell wall biosynthesis
MRPLKINYSFGRYPSLARTAGDYIDIIKTRYEMVELEDADAIVLHCVPHQFDAFFRCYPHLASKPLIAYCVWETDTLPEYFAGFVRRMTEIWTCSEYCRAVFSRYHPRVFRIPHIVRRDTGYSAADMAAVKHLVSYREGISYFLFIGMLSDPRKNVGALARVFDQVAGQMPEARLILKIRAGERPAILYPGVIYLDNDLTDAQMNALYDLSFAYVSPHHAEGWGLTLSDAMLLGKPAVATGYSGNLEFMTPDNSMLLSYREEAIRTEDQNRIFSAAMKWAYPNEHELEEKLLWLYGHRDGVGLEDQVAHARRDVARFHRDAIAPLLLARLESLE